MKTIPSRIEGAARRPRRRRRTSVFVLLGALLVVLTGATAATAYLSGLSNSFDTKTGKIAAAFPEESTRPSPAAGPGGRAPTNILLVGSDSRIATAAEAEAGMPSDQRSDSMILVHIPADRQKAYAISIMRDLWVPIPGHGTAKINAALAFGGVPLMVQTVESLLGQRIDHVVFMDFEGFRNLTDSVGGVDVDVPVAFSSTMSENPGLPFPKGPMHLDGRSALAFVHERYAFPDGDYQRVRNQQIFLKALIGKIARPEVVANPSTVSALVDGLSPYLTVDAGLTSQALVALAFELKDIRPSDVVAFTMPTGGTGWSDDGQSVVLADRGAMSSLSRAMANATMPDFVSTYRLVPGT